MQWQVSIRHALTVNKNFVKLSKSGCGRGHPWTLASLQEALKAPVEGKSSSRQLNTNLQEVPKAPVEGKSPRQSNANLQEAPKAPVPVKGKSPTRQSNDGDEDEWNQCNSKGKICLPLRYCHRYYR